MIKIGINGFGRIGRMVFRSALQSKFFKVVGINDLYDIEYLAYLLKYDSTHSQIKSEIKIDGNYLIVDENKIKVTSKIDPNHINWTSSEAEYIVESTGKFLNEELASKHLKSGAKKVILSAPSKDEIPMFVFGVNHMKYQKEMNIVSNSSCTTNCIAPILKVVNQNFGIVNGLMTTIHAITSSQSSIDGFDNRNWRLGRGAIQNIIPTSTGATVALSKVMPELQNRITGNSYRVPVSNVSVVDINLNLEKGTSFENLCRIIKKSSESKELMGILGYEDGALVSSDFVSDKRTSIFDAGASMMLNDNLVKLVCWYDNEYAYANKLIDLIRHMYDIDNN